MGSRIAPKLTGILASLLYVAICIMMAESGGAPTPQALGHPQMCAQSGCHVGLLNAQPALLTVTGFPSPTYVPGASYTVTVSVANNPTVGASEARGGFAAYVARNANAPPTTAPVGTIALIDPNTRQILYDGGGAVRIPYVTHNNPLSGSPAVATFRWTAPASGGSDAVLVVASNSANGNGQESGDIITRKTFIATAGAACTFSINPSASSFTAAGGTASVAVTAGDGCAWTAVSNAAFITVTSGASGSGNGTVGLSVAANTATTARTGTVTIADQTFTVTQDAAECIFAVAPATVEIAATGGGDSVAVTAAAGCAWTAASNDGFISITSAPSGSGNGTVAFTVAANASSAARSGTLTVAGQTVTVNQAGTACVFTLDPTSSSFAAVGGTGNIAVAAASGCAWTVASNAAFITVTGGASGTGNGTVAYSVAANTTANARSGTLTVAGQTFTVNQAAAVACSFTVAPTSVQVAGVGGSGSVAVTAGAGCAWTAVSNAASITVTSGASGSGNGSVVFAVLANNTTVARSGTLTVAGQTVTVNQAAGQLQNEKAYFAQFGNGDLGGGQRLTSTVILLNTSAAQTAVGTVRLFGTNGTPLSLGINGVATSGVFSFDLPPQGIRFFSTDGSGAAVTGSAQLTSTIPVSAVILFASPAGTTGVGAVQPLARFQVPIESDSARGVDTGVAAANPSESPVDLVLTLRDSDGRLITGGSTLVQLGPNGQLAKFPRELFPSINFTRFNGSVEVSAPLPVNGMAIRTSPGQFSTLPVAAVTN